MRIRAHYQIGRSIMRKALVLLTILAPAVLAADVASAAKSYAECGSAFAACQIRCSGQKVFVDACFNRCESNRKSCANSVASGGKPGTKIGGNAVVTTPKSSRGSMPIQ